MEILPQLLLHPLQLFTKKYQLGMWRQGLEVIINFFPIQKKLIDLKVWTKKYNSFSKAWNASKPKFKEFPIKLPNFMGSIDEIYEIDGGVVISDLKSSTLVTGKYPNSDRYQQRGMSGINQEYIKLIVKVIGISYVTEISSNICKENGFAALASAMEIYARISVAGLCIPVIVTLFEMVSEGIV